VLDAIFSRDCAVCGTWLDDSCVGVCWDCARRLTLVTEPFCRRCGDPVDGDIHDPFDCSSCRRQSPVFARARSVYRFREPLNALVRRFKYQADLELVRLFLDGMTACIRVNFDRSTWDAVVDVPLTRRRERERTFNQSRLLAGELAVRLRVELAPRQAIVRVRETRSQTGLHAARRRENVRGAFASFLPSWVMGRRFLLVDDVMTTGATVDACAAALKAEGAVRVDVLTVARG